MKYQPPKDFLAELVASAPPEEQQSLRTEIKSLQLSPTLAALIAQHIEATVRSAKAPPSDSGASTKLDAIATRLSTMETCMVQKLNGPTNNEPKLEPKLAEQLEGLREDMRGVQDHLVANRPLSWKKVFFVSIILLLLGGVAGWYARREYRLWQYELYQREKGVQK